ncbi:carboxy terminal-processing peptidase [Leptospira haakeii]|uniref:Peptidase n=1 Tax=Leptospira haakeii TaxID=2023198 RepID=A0ABX4PMT7_9LEPT|nr:carboxy terminal-processing peptidase [Leptospira haakeii]PKA15349.1 peptidase [Leptospira haakeii]PKA18821.1 peptidase [Leptospira haakeii]
MRFAYKRLALYSILVLLPVAHFSDSEITPADKAAHLVKILEEQHYGKAKLLNRKYYLNSSERFLSELDPQGLIYLKEDMQKFSTMFREHQNFSELNPALWEIAIKFASHFRNRLSLFMEMLDQDSEEIHDEFKIYTKGKTEYQKDLPSLKKRWASYIESKTLQQFFEIGKYKSPEEFSKAFQKERKKIRRSILNFEIYRLRNSLTSSAELIDSLGSDYLDAMLKELDPHSSFYSDSFRKKFRSPDLDQGLSFGLEFEHSQYGDTRISEIYPGGAAWNSGEIHKGDKIVEIRSSLNSDIGTDVADISADELYILINREISRKAFFKVRKLSGKTVWIQLQKTKKDKEEDFIFTQVLEGEKKIGYIYLPSFYTDSETDQLGCSEDIARAILKLKRESIEGLILDVRDNYGGSLQEAMDLAGLFIDEGPLFLGENSNRELNILKDPNRGRIYSGPLLILQNYQSASGPEFLSHVLKDYNRALIVGSSSFGKASSQKFLAIKEGKYKIDKIKLTTGLYYGLDNVSHQQKGVTPHIELPQWNNSPLRETDLENSLLPNSISKEIRYEILPELPIRTLKNKSSDRIEKNQFFQKIESVQNKAKKWLSKPKEIPLDPKEFFEFYQEREKVITQINEISVSKSSIFSSQATSFDKKSIHNGSLENQIFKSKKDRLESDPYVEESYNIINDFINYNEGK